jgi:hypothetical protein
MSYVVQYRPIHLEKTLKCSIGGLQDDKACALIYKH